MEPPTVLVTIAVVELGVGVHLRLGRSGIGVAVFLDVQLEAVFATVLGEDGDDGVRRWRWLCDDGRNEQIDKTDALHGDRGRCSRGLIRAVIACKTPEAIVWSVEALVKTPLLYRGVPWHRVKVKASTAQR